MKITLTPCGFRMYRISVMSCVEALNLIHVYVECTDSLYPRVQCLVVELNYYMLPEVIVFNAGSYFITISDI